jgi:Protein of unknown function (DUF3592)
VDVTFRGRAGVGLGVSLGAVILLFSGVLDSLAPTPRGLILVAAGVTLLGVVLPLQLRTRTLLKHGVKVQGTVVDAEEKTGRGSDNLPYRTYHPVVEFTTTDGRTVTFTSGLGFSGRQPRIGGAVPVRYHPDDPEQAELDRAYIWMVPAAPSLLAGVGLLVAAVVAFTDEPWVAPAAEESQVAPTVVDSPDDSVTGEPVPTGPLPAKVATGRIGDTLTVTDRTGKAQLEITVTRVAFTTGDQASPPPRRFYMGVHVEAHALADEQHLIMAALVDGHYYDELALVSSAGLQPMLGLDELSLNQGQRVAGWLELEVPTRHGQLVLRDETLQHKVAVWTY